MKKLKPWLVQSVTDINFSKDLSGSSRTVKVTINKDVEGPGVDGELIVKVCDGEVFMWACLLHKAVENFDESWLHSQSAVVPSLDNLVIDVEKYQLKHRLEPEQKKCDYLLIIEEFSKFSIQTLNTRGNLKNIMDIPEVRQKSDTLWEQHKPSTQQPTMTDKTVSQFPMTQLLGAADAFVSNKSSKKQQAPEDSSTSSGPSNAPSAPMSVERKEEIIKMVDLSEDMELCDFIIPDQETSTAELLNLSALQFLEIDDSILPDDLDLAVLQSAVKNGKSQDTDVLPQLPADDSRRNVTTDARETSSKSKQKTKRKFLLVSEHAPTKEQSPSPEPRPGPSAQNTKEKLSARVVSKAKEKKLVDMSVQVTQSLWSGDRQSQEAQVGPSLPGPTLGANVATTLRSPDAITDSPAKENLNCMQSTQADHVPRSQIPTPDFPMSPVLISSGSERSSKEDNCATVVGEKGQENEPCSEVVIEKAQKLVIAVPYSPRSKSVRRKDSVRASNLLEEERLRLLQQTPCRDHVDDSNSKMVKSDSVTVPFVDLTEASSQEGRTVSNLENTESNELDNNTAEESKNIDNSVKETKKDKNPRVALHGNTRKPAKISSQLKVDANKPAQDHIVISKKGYISLKMADPSYAAGVDASTLFVKPTAAEQDPDLTSRRGKRKLLTTSSKPFAKSPKEDIQASASQENINASTAGKRKGTSSMLRGSGVSKKQSSKPESKQRTKQRVSPSSSRESVKNLTLPTPVNSLPSHQPPRQAAQHRNLPACLLQESSGDLNLKMEKLQALLSGHCKVTSKKYVSNLQEMPLPDELQAQMSTFFGAKPSRPGSS